MYQTFRLLYLSMTVPSHALVGLPAGLNNKTNFKWDVIKIILRMWNFIWEEALHLINNQSIC